MNRKPTPGPMQAVGKAYQLMQGGQLADAEMLLRQILFSAPKFPPALHLLGLVRQEKGATKEALTLIQRAVELAPTDVDAWRNLGNLQQDVGDLAASEASFRRVLKLAPRDIAARGNLGVILEETGRIDEAISEFRALIRNAPKELDALRRLAALLRKTKQHREEVAVARELVRLCPTDAALKRAVSRSYFLLFDSVDRQPEEARAVLTAWLAFDPDDPVARHMSAAYTQSNTPERASNDYIERHFNEFAETFDQVLDSLEYRGPQLIDDALKQVDPTPTASYQIADVGCGTGKSGPFIRPWARTLVGVDLSKNMLDLARQKGMYDELVHQEATAFLEGHVDTFDVILCTDTLIYFGDIRALFSAVARALRPGGRFLGTAELMDGDEQSFRLEPAGRYVHSARYLASTLEDVGLTLEHMGKETLRIEYGKPTLAQIITARRLGSGQA